MLNHECMLGSWSDAVLLGLVAGLCGCVTDGVSGFAYRGAGMKEGVATWRAKAPAKTQATIEALSQDETLLIHFIRGDLSDMATRGAVAILSSSPLARKACLLHPRTEGIRPERNWDVIYDQRRQEEAERTLGFQSPLEALLHHEVIGHVMPVLANPDLLKRLVQSEQLRREIENAAVQHENEYRVYQGLPPVPPTAKPAPVDHGSP